MAAILTLTGTLAIFAHKFNKGYSIVPASWHALIGSLALLGIAAQYLLHRKAQEGLWAAHRRHIELTVWGLCVVSCALGASKTFDESASGSLWIWLLALGLFVKALKTEANTKRLPQDATVAQTTHSDEAENAVTAATHVK
jgi:hypothetical protein